MKRLYSISAQESIILEEMLASVFALRGCDIQKRLDKKINPNTFYNTLYRLERKGYVTSPEEKNTRHVPGPSRRYRPTELAIRIFAVLEDLESLRDIEKMA